MQVTKTNAAVVKTLIEAVLDTRFQFRTLNTLVNLTGSGDSIDLFALAEGLGFDTSKKRRRDGATLIGLGEADRTEMKALHAILVAVSDVRYDLRTISSIGNKADLPADLVENVADQFGFTVKHRNSDGAALVGFGE